MPEASMPQWVIERVLRRRGRLHCHADLQPHRTALVVIDMQNFFLGDIADVGGPVSVAGKVPGADKIAPQINRLARAIRETGGTVCWVQHTVDDRSRAEWSNWLAMGVAERQSALEDLKVGSGGHALIPALETEPGDEFVRKYRYSAFIQGSSDLPELLRAKGCDTVAVVGALTNVCCESSARDAMMLNFKTIMVSDANASHTQEEHLASLASFYASFGDVMSTDELIGYLRRPGVRRDAVETAETPRRFGQAPATSAT